jgi:hypothetical protein
MGTMHLATTQGASTSGDGVMRQQCFTLVAFRGLLPMVSYLSFNSRWHPRIDSFCKRKGTPAVHGVDCYLVFSLTDTMRRTMQRMTMALCGERMISTMACGEGMRRSTTRATESRLGSGHKGCRDVSWLLHFFVLGHKLEFVSSVVAKTITKTAVNNSSLLDFYFLQWYGRVN